MNHVVFTNMEKFTYGNISLSINGKFYKTYLNKHRKNLNVTKIMVFEVTCDSKSIKIQSNIINQV